MSIELVMPSNHLILCCPLLLLPSIFPSIRVFSNESVLHVRGPWNYEPCHAGPPKMDGSWWRVLTKCGPLEKGMANHFSILALRTPWTVWKYSTYKWNHIVFVYMSFHLAKCPVGLSMLLQMTRFHSFYGWVTFHCVCVCVCVYVCVCTYNIYKIS